MFCYVLVISLIGFDIVTGLTKALKNGNVSSKYLREGLFRKCGEIFTLFAGWLFEFVNETMETGVAIPLASSIATYIAIMEIVSIIENICEINPELERLFHPYLAQFEEKEKDDDVKRD